VTSCQKMPCGVWWRVVGSEMEGRGILTSKGGVKKREVMLRRAVFLYAWRLPRGLGRDVLSPRPLKY
jgi:hypothetical protein